MGYFPVRYDARVVNYDRRGFIRLATGGQSYSDTSAYGECSLTCQLNILWDEWDCLKIVMCPGTANHNA